MKNSSDLEGRCWRLPNGQIIAIESCEGDSAVCRRISGPRQGSLAICRVTKLRPLRPRKQSSGGQQEAPR